MRHRGENHTSRPSTTQGETDRTGTLATLSDLMATRQSMLPPKRQVSSQVTVGKHRALIAMPQIPEQKLPTHDTDVAEGPVVEPVVEPVVKVLPLPQPSKPATEIPLSAQWRASHLPRVFAGSLLALAVLGSSGLGVRYAQSRSSDNFVSLVIGLAVVVVLWALMIASTPQKVTLSGSVLTVHNTSGSERFDLVDALQPVDVVGDPRTSYWAVLLHRPNSTTVVLRRNEVDATELDPIVRHYRAVALQRHAERDARFNS
jgi:hypothetical protein